MFGSSSTVFCSSANAVRISFASSDAFASFQCAAGSFGTAFTAFLYSITASLNFSSFTYSSPRLTCLASFASGERSQEPKNTATTIQHAIMIFERRMFASVKPSGMNAHFLFH